MIFLGDWHLWQLDVLIKVFLRQSVCHWIVCSTLQADILMKYVTVVTVMLWLGFLRLSDDSFLWKEPFLCKSTFHLGHHFPDFTFHNQILWCYISIHLKVEILSVYLHVYSQICFNYPTSLNMSMSIPYNYWCITWTISNTSLVQWDPLTRIWLNNIKI